MILVGTFHTTDNRSGHILLDRGSLKYVSTLELKKLYKEKRVSNIEMFTRPVSYYVYDIIQIRVRIFSVGKQSLARCKKICLTPNLVIVCAMNDRVVRFWHNCNYYNLYIEDFITYLNEHRCAYCNFSIVDNNIMVTTNEKVVTLGDCKVSRIESVDKAILATCEDLLEVYRIQYPGNVDYLIHTSGEDFQRDDAYIYECIVDKATGKYTFYRKYKNGVKEKANYTSEQKKYLKQTFESIIKTGLPF